VLLVRDGNKYLKKNFFLKKLREEMRKFYQQSAMTKIKTATYLGQ
jgi:hypothetical protein